MKKRSLSKDRELHAYVVGAALGDGNLSSPNGRVARLRITCDMRYPAILKSLESALKKLLPDNKVSRIQRKGCVDLSVSSNHLENVLGWKAKNGSKFKQNASVPTWVKKENSYIEACLRGLIETDGSIYADRGYKMVIFSTIIPKLALDVFDMIQSLGFNPHLYSIKPTKNKYNFNQQNIYHVRLSKNVAPFLRIIRPKKP